MDDESSKKAEIVKLIRDGAKPVSKRRKPKATTNVAVNGDGNIIAGRDVIHTDHIKHVTTVEYKPGQEHITPDQRQRLKELVKEVVATEAAVKTPGRSYGAVWGAFQSKFKVPKYELLPIARFPEAVKYFQTTLGRLRSAKSAPKKLPDWRTKLISAIQSRCNERGLQDWRKKYMLERFGKLSSKELDDDQVKQLYSAVFGKK